MFIYFTHSSQRAFGICVGILEDEEKLIFLAHIYKLNYTVHFFKGMQIWKISFIQLPLLELEHSRGLRTLALLSLSSEFIRSFLCLRALFY